MNIKNYLLILAISVVTITQACKPKESKEQESTAADSYYTEKYRPQIHFSPEANWMNDPNGMVYYEGEYHLFYQYYPDSTVWGPMHWGHAVSEDLVHWEHLPIALYPDSLGYIFSGSAVIDWNNTSGLGTGEQPPMIAIFTYHDMKGERVEKRNDFQTQGIAYSLDKGRTWKKYENNPVLPNPGIRDFRDPKVFWHKETEKWIMIFAAQDRVKLYSSLNLKDWTFESDFGMELGAHGGVWECPDLFELPVEGANEKKWVMLVSINPGGPNGGSATQYFIGDFNGHKFEQSSNETRWVDFGKDNYAGVTWSDIPEQDGRRLFIGWMSNWQYAEKVPTSKWRSAMTIPRELKLMREAENYHLVSMPVVEIDKLKGKCVKKAPKLITGEVEIELEGINLNASEMSFVFQPVEGSQFGQSVAFGMIFHNKEGEQLKVGYDLLSKQFLVDRTQISTIFSNTDYSGKAIAPYTIDKSVEMKVLMDASSIEVFVDGGKLVITNILFPSSPFNRLTLYSNMGSTKLISAEFTELNSIW